MWNLGLLGASLERLSDYELISTTILTTNEASITFSNLGDYSSTYKHLQIRAVAKTDAGGNNNGGLRLNGDTGSNYAWHHMVAVPTSVVGDAQTSQTSMQLFYLSTTEYGSAVIDILDAYSTTKNKTLRILQGNTLSNRVSLSSGLFMSTASTTSVTLLANRSGSAAYQIGSRFSIYGIRG
jgi:hypothetical protein